MAVRRAFVVLVATLALVPSGCGGDGSGQPPPQVERVARQLAGAGFASVIVFVTDGDDEYVATAGTAVPARASGSGSEA
jgi:hypothetical protein